MANNYALIKKQAENPYQAQGGFGSSQQISQQSFPQQQIQQPTTLFGSSPEQIEKTKINAQNFVKSVGSFLIKSYAPVIPETIKRIKAGEQLIPAYFNAYKQLNLEEQQEEARIIKLHSQAKEGGASEWQLAQIITSAPSIRRTFYMAVGSSTPIKEVNLKAMSPSQLAKVMKDPAKQYFKTQTGIDITKSTPQQIQQAYFKLSHKLHPDMPTGSQEAFIELKMFYDITKTNTTQLAKNTTIIDWFRNVFAEKVQPTIPKALTGKELAPAIKPTAITPKVPAITPTIPQQLQPLAKEAEPLSLFKNTIKQTEPIFKEVKLSKDLPQRKMTIKSVGNVSDYIVQPKLREAIKDALDTPIYTYSGEATLHGYPEASYKGIFSPQAFFDENYDLVDAILINEKEAKNLVDFKTIFHEAIHAQRYKMDKDFDFSNAYDKRVFEQSAKRAEDFYNQATAKPIELEGLAEEARKAKDVEEFVSNITKNTRPIREAKIGELVTIQSDTYGEKSATQYNMSVPTQGEIVKINPKSVSIKVGNGNIYKLPATAKVSVLDLKELKGKDKQGIQDFYTQAKGITPEAQKGVKEAVKPEIREVIPTEEIALKKPQDSIKIVMDALAKAKKITPIQEYIYTKERGEKLAKAVSVGAKVSGEKGFIAQLGQLKGDMKVQFESLRTQIGQEDVDNLFNLITKDTTLSEWNKINAKQGLAKLLGEYGTGIPTPGEIKLLKDVFGDDFTNTILDKRNLLQKLANVGYELANVPRAVMASFDLSAPLRQGIFFIGKPKQFLPAFVNMFKQFGSQKAFDATQEAITELPSYKLMQEGGLQLTEMGGELTQREEAYMSSWAEKIPLAGIGIKASNRAYTGFLNKLRADVFDDFIKHASNVGLNPEKNPKLIREIANLVNAGTGRGALGVFEKSATWLNTLFFSPRLMASRLTLLNPIYYTKADPFVRKEALKSLLSFLGIGLTILGLAKANGAKVESDPRSADFAKIKIKDTRLDVWGGFQQIFRTVAQVASGKIISTTTGREMILGEGYRPLTRADIIQRFFEYKTSPVFSFILAMLEGKTAIGDEFKVSKEVGLRLVPMVMQDMYDAVKEYNWVQGMGLSLPAIFGVGVQTYKPKPINELRIKIRDGEATTADIQQAIKDGLIKPNQIVEFIEEAKLPNDIYNFKKKSAEAQVDFLDGMAKEDMVKYLPYTKTNFNKVLQEKAQERQQQESQKPQVQEGKTSDTNIIHTISLYAKAIGTDPVTAFNRIFTGQKIRRIDSKTIIVERMPFAESQAVREERGVVGDMRLDHTIPLVLGGSNSEDNLKLVSYDEWKSYTPVENKLGKLLRDGEITKQKAQQLIKDFKEGKITANEIYNL